jgi:hypothetical protein
MRIGIDFDNTIVCYDGLFHCIALERSLIDETVPVSKQAIRDYLRRCGLETEWTKLQGLVYGARINEAEAYPGVIDFISKFLQAGAEISIISHKTKTPYAGPPYDLHATATDWLSRYKIGVAGVFEAITIDFELTREDKLQKIRKRNCSIFVDDLPEFLNEPAFPIQTQKILFDPNDINKNDNRYLRVNSWSQITEFLKSKTHAV